MKSRIVLFAFCLALLSSCGNKGNDTGKVPEYAVQELLASETSISDIAWDNGFGSVSQFNKIFRKKYKMSPREYKEKWKEGSISEENETSLKVEDLEEYRSKTRLTVVKEQRFQIKDIRVDMTKGEKLVNPWKEGINLGFASLLLNAEYQRQMKMMQKFQKQR